MAKEANDAWHGSYHWMYGRILSAATLGSIVTAMAIPEPLPMVDLALNVVIPLHCQLGFNEVITDYVPKYKFPKVYPVAKGAVMAGTALTMFGLFQYNTKDVGITEGFRSVWRASSQVD